MPATGLRLCPLTAYPKQLPHLVNSPLWLSDPNTPLSAPTSSAAAQAALARAANFKSTSFNPASMLLPRRAPRWHPACTTAPLPQALLPHPEPFRGSPLPAGTSPNLSPALSQDLTETCLTHVHTDTHAYTRVCHTHTHLHLLLQDSTLPSLLLTFTQAVLSSPLPLFPTTMHSKIHSHGGNRP